MVIAGGMGQMGPRIKSEDDGSLFYVTGNR